MKKKKVPSNNNGPNVEDPTQPSLRQNYYWHSGGICLSQEYVWFGQMTWNNFHLQSIFRTLL